MKTTYNQKSDRHLATYNITKTLHKEMQTKEVFAENINWSIVVRDAIKNELKRIKDRQTITDEELNFLQNQDLTLKINFDNGEKK